LREGYPSESTAHPLPASLPEQAEEAEEAEDQHPAEYQELAVDAKSQNNQQHTTIRITLEVKQEE
jgi:hypothetical protein